MTIANQGHRRDKNLDDSRSKVQALDNLGGTGITDDLRILENNLRNKSHLPFNSVDETTDEFIFNTNKVLNINSIESVPTNDGLSTRVTIIPSVPYNTYAGETIILSNVNTTGIGTTVFNGEYLTSVIGAGGTFIQYIKSGIASNLSVDSAGLTTATATLISNVEFIYTKDDVVGVSKTVSLGSTSLFPNTDYYVCNSDSESKFKISLSPSTVGLNTVNVTTTPTTNFDFIRKEPVVKQNLINFVQPEIQEQEGDFSYLYSNTINTAFELTQQEIEDTLFLIEEKYKGTSNTDAIKDIKLEGTLQLNDPAGYIVAESNLSQDISPGMFIANTRAFSSENNPWEKVTNDSIKTSSDEVNAGEIIFHDGLTIEGLGSDVQTGLTAVDPTSFTHKIGIVVNGETYFLLLKS